MIVIIERYDWGKNLYIFPFQALLITNFQILLVVEFVISLVCLITRKIWSDGQTSITGLGWTSVTGLCNFLGCTSVTAQFYLEIKGKYILEAWGHANPKDPKRREAHGPILAPHFICFSLPLDPALYNWDSQECSLFYLRSSLWSLVLHLFYFCGLLPLSFSHHHSGLFFPILIT